MTTRRATLFRKGLLPGALLLLTAIVALALQIARADSGPTERPVTATPPLQAVPATPVSKNVQTRMRGCNAVADAKKLQTGARETFIKTCMAPHHPRPALHPGSQPKPNP